MRIRPILWP